MIAALILYGSKARGDGQAGSDTDLMGISDNKRKHEKHEHGTTNLHVYSSDWLLEESSKGGLFLMHIAFEAVAIYDPSGLLQNISQAFAFKPSYAEEIETGVRILRAVKDLPVLEFDDFVRRRYFWALRTVGIALAADRREIKFGADDLQKFTKIFGLAEHIRSRDSASFVECSQFCRGMLKFCDEELDVATRSKVHASVSELHDLTAFRKKVQNEQDYVER